MAVKVSVGTKEKAAAKKNQCLRKTSKTSSTESPGTFFFFPPRQKPNEKTSDQKCLLNFVLEKEPCCVDTVQS